MTTSHATCPTCAYPHELERGCDNPACPDNPRHTAATRAAILARVEAYRAEQAADAERRRLYGQSFTTTRRQTP